MNVQQSQRRIANKRERHFFSLNIEWNERGAQKWDDWASFFVAGKRWVMVLGAKYSINIGLWWICFVPPFWYFIDMTYLLSNGVIVRYRAKQNCYQCGALVFDGFGRIIINYIEWKIVGDGSAVCCFLLIGPSQMELHPISIFLCNEKKK